MSVSLGEGTLPQGGTTYLVVGFRNMPKDPQNSGAYHPDLRYRLDLERNTDGTWGDANDCELGEFDRDINFSPMVERGTSHRGHVKLSHWLELSGRILQGSSDRKKCYLKHRGGLRYPGFHSHPRAVSGNRFVVHLNYARGANRCHLEIYSSEQYSR